MFQCFDCRIPISNLQEYIQHVRESHKNLSTFTCGAKLDNGYCYKSFNSFKVFRQHVQKIHPMNSNEDSSVPNPSVKPVCSEITLAEENRVFDVPPTSKNEHSVENSSLEDIQQMVVEEPVIEELVVDEINTKGVDKTQEIFQIQPTTESVVKVKPYVLFAAKLHSYPDIPRSRVTEIINDVNELFQLTLHNIEKDIAEEVSTKTDFVDSIQTVLLTTFIATVFSEACAGFEKIKTEWRCFKTFEKFGTFIPPTHLDLGQREEFVHGDEGQTLKMIKVTAQFISIRYVFQKFFEIPGYLEKTLQYVNFLRDEKNVISNVIQGSLWQNISKKFQDKIVFPLYLYYDDYENNNPLGSHNGIAKCGAVYLSIACLPPFLASKLKNIFLFILFNTLDRQTYHNKVVFSKAIEELKFLESRGIAVDLPEGKKNIFFKLVLIIGDNLGLHSLLGFAEGFNANYFCRFCKTVRENIQNVFDEINCEMRTKSSYEADLAKKNVTETGIVGPCVFHDIEDFHVTRNFVVDVMHDLLEGICQFDLGKLFYQFIHVDNFFTLEQLNNYIRAFDYGYSKNKPTEILDFQIKKKKLKMSSSEMLCLIRYIPLIIGPLIPDKRNNKHWQLLLQLHELVEKLVSPSFTSDEHSVLRLQISDYLRLLQELFPHSFKPKHHFLVHYVTVLLLCGPFWKFCSMRFEQKNQEAKKTSKTTLSRVNIARTIAIKHQLILNYRLLMNETVENNHYIEKEKVRMSELQKVTEYKDLLPLEMQKESIVTRAKKIIIGGQEITNKILLMVPSDNGPLFIRVKEILFTQNNKILIIGKLLLDIYFDEDLQGFEVFSQTYEWRMFTEIELFYCQVTHMTKIIGGKLYIVKCWA